MLAEFTDKQPDYRYMKTSETEADVFVYSFIEEKENVFENIVYEETDESENEDVNVSESEDVVEENNKNDEIIKFVDDVEYEESQDGESNGTESETSENDGEDMNNNFRVETVTQKVYIYDVNIFHCNTSEITEEMVKNNLEYYLKYVPKSRIEKIEEIVEEHRKQIESLSMYILDKQNIKTTRGVKICMKL